MLLKNLFEKLRFSKISSPESLKAAQDSMQNIVNAFGVLDEKAKNLREKYPEQEQHIHACFEDVKKIGASVSVRAGKFEQALAQQITKMNSLIDKLFISNDEGSLNDELKTLERYVRVRANAGNGSDDE